MTVYLVSLIFNWSCSYSDIDSIKHTSDSDENTRTGIGKYNSLCTHSVPPGLLPKQYPATSSVATLAPTNIAYHLSIPLCHSQTVQRKQACAAKSTYCLGVAKKKGKV